MTSHTVKVVGASNSSKAVLGLSLITPNNVLCLWYATVRANPEVNYITLMNDSIEDSVMQIPLSAHRLHEAIRSKVTRVAKTYQQLSSYGEKCTTIDVQGGGEVINPMELQNDIMTLQENVEEMRYIMCKQ